MGDLLQFMSCVRGVVRACVGLAGLHSLALGAVCKHTALTGTKDCASFHGSPRESSKLSSKYDICKMFGFLDPLPLLAAFGTATL